ncbi:MAG: flagellar filament capping protein FliD [Bacteriovoracaceae bacterium]|nr:flagellar filament capping protein FliD [Bacteriovoracaceae bacterium]
MSISFGSINTGLPKDIVQQIIKAERIPMEKMEARKGKIEGKQKLLGELIGHVESIRGEVLANRGEKSFRELKVVTEAENVQVTLDKNVAMPGNYQFEVSRLAQKSSALTNRIKDKDSTYLGVGYISYELPNGESKEIYVDEEHSSLTGIAKLINANSESGMTATVVDDGKDKNKPFRLILSVKDSGDKNQAQFPYFYLVDGREDLYVEEERKAVDAVVKMDGFEVELPTNKVANLIPGVTIDLKKAKPGEEFSIQITEDTKKIGEKIGKLLASINNVLDFIHKQNSLDEKSDTTKTLGGDITLQQIESRIRGAVFQPIETSNGPKRISDLGVAFNRKGQVEFNQERFEKFLSEDYKVVSQVIIGKYGENGTKTDGFLDNIYRVVDQSLQRPNGTLQSRRGGLQSNIDQIDRQIETKQRMLEQKERILKDKFARLEETMARIKEQGAGLTGMAQGGVPGVTQLG